jgi:hypothetical protein
MSVSLLMESSMRTANETREWATELMPAWRDSNSRGPTARRELESDFDVRRQK